MGGKVLKNKQIIRPSHSLGAPRVLRQSQPILSFIIPIYNKIRYLNECLQSILEQDVADIQIVCVDDASTDGSYELLTSFKIDRRFVIVRNDRNQGAGATRNTGLQRASAQYVRFVDADDILPHKSSAPLLEAAEKAAVPLVRGNIEYFYDPSEPTRLLAPVCDGGPVEFADHESLRIPWYFSSYLIKRTELLASGAEFPNLRIGEDVVFLARLLSHSPYVMTVGQVVYRYRSRYGQGRSLKYTRSEVEDYIRHAHLVKAVFLQHNYERCWNYYRAILIPDFNEVLSRAVLEENEIEALKKQLPR